MQSTRANVITSVRVRTMNGIQLSKQSQIPQPILAGARLKIPTGIYSFVRSIDSILLANHRSELLVTWERLQYQHALYDG